MEDLEQLRYSGLFEARVPRYTSYPPANRFIVAEGKLMQARWLNSVPYGSDISIYLHIPYCSRMCWFCACRTQAAENAAAIEAYAAAVRDEISLVQRELPESVRLTRLYLGGGTPTMLSPEAMNGLLQDIYAAFPRATSFECIVEIDTTQVDPALLSGLIDNGMTRAVVGVQDFDRTVQDAIGRWQSFDQTLNVIQTLRTEGLQHLDMEMLYGLPGQSPATIAETAQQVVAFDPDRVAVCEYAHMPNVAKRQILIDARKLPMPENAFLMSQVSRQILLSDGYEPIGVDHFARPGDSLVAARDQARLRRDFQGYTDNSAYASIGLGASAISRFPQGYVQNSSATTLYLEKVQQGRLSGNRGYRLTATDLMIACMIEMLMCRFMIEKSVVAEKFPGSADFVDRAIKSITTVFEPYVETTPEALLIKPVAYPLARLMSNILDRIVTSER
jgi:oxygen-independent coproporphyrinogen-3 oxidase